MILPIVIYGNPLLNEPAEDIDKDYPGLTELIANMYETMENAQGVGLAAPQIGKGIRLFVIDTTHMVNSKEEPIRKVFINAEIQQESEKKLKMEEGCLSIPGLREKVDRPESIVMRYWDENFVQHEDPFSGMAARVIQHEYDHIEGILFTDVLSPFKKRLIAGKLAGIGKGEYETDYPTKRPDTRKR